MKHTGKKIQYGLHKTFPVMGWLIGLLSLEVGYISITAKGTSIFKNPVFWGSVGIVIVGVVVFLFFYIRYDKEFKYINAQINAIKKAEKSILICMRSLGDENRKSLYKKFNDELQRKVDDKISVRIIAPELYTKERLLGAKQLNERKINIRFVHGLYDNDCRFILVDGNNIVFSQQDLNSNELSREFSHVQSRVLGGVLTNYFDSVWDEKNGTLEFEQYYDNGKDQGVV